MHPNYPRLGIKDQGATYPLPWTAGVSVIAGDERWVPLSDGPWVQVYRAAGAGTTGAAAPSHAKGAGTDGGVSWLCLGRRAVPVPTPAELFLFMNGNALGGVPAPVTDALAWTENLWVREGGIGDGASHPVSEWLDGGPRSRGYVDLDTLRLDYPFVKDSFDEIDVVALQKAHDRLEAGGGGTVVLPPHRPDGKRLRLRWNRPVVFTPRRVGLAANGAVFDARSYDYRAGGERHLLADTGFDDASSWAVQAAGVWVFSGGRVKKNGTGSPQKIYQAAALTAGTTYTLTYTIDNPTGVGTIRPLLYNPAGGTTVLGPTQSVSGTYSVDLVAAAGNSAIGLEGTGGFQGFVELFDAKAFGSDPARQFALQINERLVDDNMEIFGHRAFAIGGFDLRGPGRLPFTVGVTDALAVIKDDNAVIGIDLATPPMGAFNASRATRCELHNVHINGFTQGLRYGDKSFLNQLRYVEIERHNIGVHCEGGLDAGENLVGYNVLTHDNNIALLVGDVGIKWVDSAFDYNSKAIDFYGNGIIDLIRTRFERGTPQTAAEIDFRSTATGQLNWENSRIILSSPIVANLAGKTFVRTTNTAQQVFMDRNFFNQMKYDHFITGPGTSRLTRSKAYPNRVWPLKIDTNNTHELFRNGAFSEPAVPGNVMLARPTTVGVGIDRHNNGVIALSIEGGALRVRKLVNAGTAGATVYFFARAPIDQYVWWYLDIKKEAGTNAAAARALTFYMQYFQVNNTDGDGFPQVDEVFAHGQAFNQDQLGFSFTDGASAGYTTFTTYSSAVQQEAYLCPPGANFVAIRLDMFGYDGAYGDLLIKGVEAWSM